MDGFGYGGSSGSSYPYWPISSNPTSSSSASAPPFITGCPVESYGRIEEFSGPMNFYGSSHRSPTDWQYNSGCLGVIKSQSSSSSFYADYARLGSRGPGGEDSYKGMFAPSGMFTSREAPSVGAVHANENLHENHHVFLVPTYNSATLVPGSSSTIMQTRYSQEPYIHSHHASYNDFETAKTVSSCHVEPYINNSIAPLPLSSLETQASFGGSDTRVHLGDREPLPSNSSVVKDELDNYLGVQSSLQSSCISPVNFDALLGFGEATGLSKPLSAGLGLHSPTSDLPCWVGARASHSPAFDIKSSGSLLDNKPEASSGSFLYPRPKASVGDMDKDSPGGSLNGCENSKTKEDMYWNLFMVSDSEGPSGYKFLSKESQSGDAMRVEHVNDESAVNQTTHLSDSNQPSRDDVFLAKPEPCRNRNQNCSEDKLNVQKNSKASESRFWDHFMVSASDGPSTSKLLSKESQSCDAMRVEYGNAESPVSDTTRLSDSANQQSRDDVVPANPAPCKNREQHFSEDKMNAEKMTTVLTDLGLKQRRSEADDVSNCDSSGRHFCSLQDLPCPTSSPKTFLVVNAMHKLSELLVYERSSDGSRLKQEHIETLEKVVVNLTKCLKENTKRKTEAGEASLQKQAMFVSTPDMVKLHEVPKLGATDFQGHDVKPLENRYGGFAFTETVNKDEMTQNIKSILASNFPDVKETQPQALLFKNLWLEAEAALCSTTYMARFHRVRNEIENHKLQNKGSSTDASASVQEPSINLKESVPITKNPESQTTDSLVVDESHEDNVITMNHVTRSRGFNSDSVDALLAFFSRGFSGSSEQGIDEKFKPDANCGKITSAIPEETPVSNTNSLVNDVIDRFQILKRRQAEHEHGTLNSLDSHSDLDSDKAAQPICTDEKSDQISETPTHYSQDNLEASGVTRSSASNHVSDVMERLQILKRRDAENGQKLESDSNLDPDKVVEPTAIGKLSRPMHEMPIHGSPDNLEAPSMARHDHLLSRTDHLTSEIYAGADDVKEDKVVSTHGTELSGRGYESPSDWEHVFQDELTGQKG